MAMMSQTKTRDLPSLPAASRRTGGRRWKRTSIDGIDEIGDSPDGILTKDRDVRVRVCAQGLPRVGESACATWIREAVLDFSPECAQARDS